MNIDDRDIEKGPLHEILPKFFPESISYLSELYEYRMYAEVWSNKETSAEKKRKEIGHIGYLKTLEFGATQKRRKADKVRFDYFVVANSVNYNLQKNIYGIKMAHIQLGGIQTNSIFKKVFMAKGNLPTKQAPNPEQTFHSENSLPKALEIKLEELDLTLDEESNKFYFEVSTNLKEISNKYQEMILMQILGEGAVSEKMPLLYKADRKYIRCLFEGQEYIENNMKTSNTISRLCVAWPFSETLVFDFAGTTKEYDGPCLLGTLIKGNDDWSGDTSHGGAQIDGYV